MKKNLLLLSGIILLGLNISAQAVQRNMVVLEIATGTWCYYCPGAAKAADQLIDEGLDVAVIENHNGDPYANTYSNARNTYYAVPGYPTGRFDGVIESVGGAGCPTGNVYSTYQPHYNTRHSVPSPITVCFSGSNSGNNYTINATVTKLADYSGSDLRLHLVVTESHIPVSWQGCMTEVNFVNRIMVPGANGTSFNFNSGNTQQFTLSFTKDASWNASNCEIVLFVQDNSTKEIFNASKVALNSLPANTFTLNDFSASTTSGCTPMSVNFSTTQNPGVTYTWTFEGGNPGSSGSPNPSVSYTSNGSFDVTLTGTDGVCFDTRYKPDYIHVNGAPAPPATPSGESSLCENPATLTYSINPVPNTDSYTWEFTPAEAGTMTPAGTSCTIDWNDSWTGLAHLRVRGTNSCGQSNWSNMLVISVDSYPAQCPAPTGSTALCKNAPDTHYVTAGVNNATFYEWELTPSNAGTFYQGAASIDINWADDFTGQATLRVKANNNSCEGPFSDPVTITLNNAPAAYAVTGGGAYCSLNGGGMPVGLDDSENGILYTLYVNGAPTSTTVTGTGNAVSFGNQAAAGNYTVKASNQASCITDMTGTASISIDPAMPVVPSVPAGPDAVETSVSPTSEYTTTNGGYASSYAWYIDPVNAGTIAGTTETATVTWNQTFVGISAIRVQGVNTCGSSEFTVEKSIAVNTVGLPGSETANLSLSPNPARNMVTLKSGRPLQGDITILNAFGKVVLVRANVQIQGELTLDISKLAAGTYTVLFTGKNGISTMKLLVE